jgi:hypothetical protein
MKNPSPTYELPKRDRQLPIFADDSLDVRSEWLTVRSPKVGVRMGGEGLIDDVIETQTGIVRR